MFGSKVIFCMVAINFIPVSLPYSVDTDDTDEHGHARRYWGYCIENKDDKPHLLCTNMSPLGGSQPAETSPSPWKIYTFKDTIQQFFTHPVVIGSDDGSMIFHNYVLVAKTDNGTIIGHFEYNWDASPICCYEASRSYSHEGYHLRPNLLIGSDHRQFTPNQTVLWTAPPQFTGEVKFIATVWKSVRHYYHIESKPITVIERTFRPFYFKG